MDKILQHTAAQIDAAVDVANQTKSALDALTFEVDDNGDLIVNK